MESSKAKMFVSLAILLTGGALAILSGFDTDAEIYQAQGTIIDFGEYDVRWQDIDLRANDNATSVLERACLAEGYELVMDGDGIRSINGVVSGASGSWDLYVIQLGSKEWTKLPAPYGSYKLLDYTISSWAYRADGESPTVAVDSSGLCIYGHPTASRVVSLTPTITEIVGALDAVDTLVGVDSDSRWPHSVSSLRGSQIANVGSYYGPVFEDILRTDPDVVFSDGDLYNHVQTSEKLTESGKLSILLYGGSDIDFVMDNIFIVGTVMSMETVAKGVIDDIDVAMEQINSLLSSSPEMEEVDVMIAVSTDPSPYISGSGTYIADVLSSVYGNNVFSFVNGWGEVNSELVLTSNPKKIIVLTMGYDEEESYYDTMINNLSAEWKGTDAYRMGEIYLISCDAGDMLMHPGPRIAQCMELLARIVNPGSFGDGIVVERYVGDGYDDYLTFTRSLGYDN